MEFCVCKIWAVALKWLGKTVVPEPHKRPTWMQWPYCIWRIKMPAQLCKSQRCLRAADIMITQSWTPRGSGIWREVIIYFSYWMSWRAIYGCLDITSTLCSLQVMAMIHHQRLMGLMFQLLFGADFCVRFLSGCHQGGIFAVKASGGGSKILNVKWL